jgi:hypothetical protein
MSKIYARDGVVTYKATIENTSKTDNIQARYSQKTGTHLVKRASDYYIAVERFDIPRSNLPIFLYNNSNGYDYSVTISNGGVDYFQTVVYQSYASIVRPPDAIFYVQQFLNMVNASLLAAHNASGIAGAAPMMILDTTDRFYMVIQIGYPGEIFFSNKVFQLFYTLPAIFYGYGNLTGKDFKVVVQDVGNNTFAPYYHMRQEQSSLFRWNSYKSIIITSSRIPCVLSAVGSGNAAGNNNVKVQALTDFIPLDTNGVIDRTNWSYNSINPNRVIELTSDGPIDEIEFSIYVADTSGNLIQLYIEPGENLSVNFAFYKKSIIDSHPFVLLNR